MRRKSSKYLMYDDEISTVSGDEQRKKGGKDLYNPVKEKKSYVTITETQSIQLEATHQIKVPLNSDE